MDTPPQQKVGEKCGLRIIDGIDEDMGATLVKVYKSGRLNFSDITDVSIYYDEAIVVIREAPDNVYLIIVFEASANLNLLSMTVNLIMDDINEFVKNRGKVPKEAPVEAKPVVGSTTNTVKEET